MNILYKLLIVVISCLIFISCNGQSKKFEQFANRQFSEMVFVKGGSFHMGPSQKEKKWIAPNNQPRHKVNLTGYYIDKYLVTYANFDKYTELNHLSRIDEEGYKLKAFYRTPKHPVTTVSWYQANNYCHYLAKKTGLPFDLPTEAQWEYAARDRGQEVVDATNTGTSIIGKNTPSAHQLETQPGHLDNTRFPMPVGSFPPNPLGLYDMTGSIYQWMKNWYYNYPSSAQINPQGPKTGTQKVVRGQDDLIYIRNLVSPSIKDETVGFRCVINSSKSMSELKKTVQHRT
jgi:formylglycine-generating enzyme required for sulfatase activity